MAQKQRPTQTERGQYAGKCLRCKKSVVHGMNAYFTASMEPMHRTCLRKKGAAPEREFHFEARPIPPKNEMNGRASCRTVSNLRSWRAQERNRLLPISNDAI